MAKTKHKARPQQQKPQQQAPRKQEVLTGVPARLVEDNRKQSLQIVEMLGKTALTISGGEGAEQKVAVLKSLWEMQKDAEDRQAEREFGAAKVRLAHLLPTIPKRHKIKFVDKQNNTQERDYADRVDIESVLDPLCIEHGFSKEYSTETDARGWACQVLTVRHVGGHKEVYRSPYMPLDSTGSKNNNQAAGSSSEYGKRYALIGAFNIIGVDKDDDGNMGKDPTVPKEDAFAARVAEEAEEATDKGAKTKDAKPPLSLEEAASKLETVLRNTERAKRGEVLMRNIKVIGAMEAAPELAEKAAELRKLCEEQADAQSG